MHAPRPVVHHQNRRLRAVLISGRDIDKNHPRFPHHLLGIERRILALEKLAVGQPHRELKVLALGVSLIREIGIDLVVRPDRIVAVAFGAGLLRVRIRRIGAGSHQTKKGNR